MQVKGLMPQESDIARKHPPAEPLGEMWYGITFSAVQEFVMLRDSFIGIAVYQKIENVPWRLSPIKHSRFCVFV